MLLALALVAVGLGWYCDHYDRKSESNYFAKFDCPGDEHYQYDDMLRVSGQLIDLNSHGNIFERNPMVTVNLIRMSSESYTYWNGPSAKLSPIAGRPNCARIECEYPCNIAFHGGQYVVRMECSIDGNLVATPSKFITVESPNK